MYSIRSLKVKHSLILCLKVAEQRYTVNILIGPRQHKGRPTTFILVRTRAALVRTRPLALQQMLKLAHKP